MENINHVCRYCNKDISDRVGQTRYCSKECYYANFMQVTREPIAELECIQCHSMFLPKTRQRTKYCSYVCMYEFHANKNRVKLKLRECMHCHLDYMPTRAFQIYCGKGCKARHHREAWELGISAQSLRDLPEPMTAEQEQREIVKLSPSPGFEPQRPIASTAPMALITVPKEIDIPYDDSPEEERSFCVRCGAKKTITLIDIHCKECYLAAEKERLQ